MQQVKYAITKWIWTDQELEALEWHDCRIIAIAALSTRSEFLLDIDFIWEWVNCDDQFLLWVSPATIVFENAFDVTIDLRSYMGEISIDRLTRDPYPIRTTGTTEEPWSASTWNIDCLEGEIKVTASEARMVVRSDAHLTGSASGFRIGDRPVSFATERREQQS